MKPSAKPEQKSYRKGSGLYFSAGLVFCMVLIVTAFEWKTSYSILTDSIPKFTEEGNDDTIFKPIVIPQKPTPKIEKGTVIKVVSDLPADEPEPKVPDMIEPKDDIPFDADVLGSLLGSGAPIEENVDEAIMVSQAAVPASGYDAFYKYIFEGLRVPDHVVSRNKDGKVYVSFVVDTDGSLSNIEIVKGFDQQLEKQIIKLLEEAPAWEPAIQQGRKVRTRMQLPITIKISR